MSGPPPLAPTYAESYDRFYARKDYAAECDYLEQAFGRFHPAGAVRRILDLGSGTGGHSLLLAERGYEVTGVDQSETMLEMAEAKARAGNAKVRFVRSDIRALDLGERFEAALLMFSVLGYMTTNTDLAAVLRSARRHLERGGLLLFDVWYGPTVVRQGPLERVRVLDRPGGQLIRTSTPTMHAERDLMDVRIRIWDIADGRLVSSSDEVHSVRYFFQPELELLLRGAGFTVAAFDAFPTLDRPPTDDTWDLGCVALAV